MSSQLKAKRVHL